MQLPYKTKYRLNCDQIWSINKQYRFTHTFHRLVRSHQIARKTRRKLSKIYADTTLGAS